MVDEGAAVEPGCAASSEGTGSSARHSASTVGSPWDDEQQQQRKRQRTEHLYRDQERALDLISELYTSCTSSSNRSNHSDSSVNGLRSCKCLVLCGPSGVGKRFVTQRLRPTVEANQGLLISGRWLDTNTKDDDTNALDTDGTVVDHQTSRLSWQKRRRQQQGTAACSVLLDAVRNLSNAVDEAMLHRIRDEIIPQYFAAPKDFELLCDALVPIEGFQGMLRVDFHQKQSEYHGSGASVSAFALWTQGTTVSSLSQCPLTFILCRFVGAVSTLVPLVVLLEQAEAIRENELESICQFVDDSSDSVLASTKGLLILLSYNDDGEPSAPIETLFARQRDWQSASPLSDMKQVQRVDISNLGRDDVRQWIIEHVGPDRRTPQDKLDRWTDYVNRVTLGNPRHVHFLLWWLDRCEYWDSDRSADDWMEQSQNGAVSVNDVYSLFQQILTMQDSLVQAIVETTAALLECSPHCIVTSAVLEMVLQQPCSNALLMAEEIGLFEGQQGNYQFQSSRLQKSAYDAIPMSNRAQFHLRIGRRLWKNSTLKKPFDDVDMLLTVAQQLQQGMDLVTDPTERGMVVFIQWEAGKKAMQAGAFAEAASYFEMAISGLRETAWSAEMYDITLALFNGAAEIYYSLGDFASMDRMLDTVFANARTFHDKLQAYTTLVFANGSRNRYTEAIATALDVLDKLGEPLPPNPRKTKVLLEYFKLRYLLHGKSNRFFPNLPPASDGNKVAAMTLLNFAVMYTYPFKPHCSALAIFASIRLAVDGGTTAAVAFALSAFGVLLVTLRGRIKEGFRYGMIATDLIDRVESRAWLSRIYFMVYGVINPWFCPFRESLEPLGRAQRSAMKTGDIEGSVICAWLNLVMSFSSGRHLAPIEQEATSLHQSMKSVGQTSSMSYLLPLCHLTGKLMGKSSLDIEFYNPHKAGFGFGLADREDNKQVIAFHSTCVMILCSHMGHYHLAMEAARKARDSAKDANFSIDFYEGLSCLALARDAAGWSRYKLLSKGRTRLKRLVRCAALCPSNFCNKRDLLKAELESICGRQFRSLALFEQSIRRAKNEGFVHEEGLAYERLARYHAFLNHPLSAIPYVVFARDAYMRWGADALVERLDNLMEVLKQNR